ncbi:ABC transporter permease [Pseudonocardia sp. CNS-139]|nr:ABC transporter permease [Pseudonocardia sp. CNS-139]
MLGGLPLPAVLAALAVAVAASVVVSVGLGPVSIPPLTVARSLWAHLTGAAAPVDAAQDFIVWQLRTPRVLLGVFVGAGLAVAGLLVQAMVRNPVGDPYILGLSSGASVGAVLVITSLGATAAGLFTGPAAAFLGAALTGLLVFVLSRVRGRLQPARMVLAGVALGQLLGGVTSFLLLRTRNTDAQQQVLFWMLGSLAGARWDLMGVCAVVVVVLLVPLCWQANRLNLLVLGDDGASALGTDPTRTRAWLFVAVGLLTGTAVAVSGSIGFVGLVVPNLARLLFGADHRRTLPVCALLGALVIVWSDAAARLVLAPSELPIGILTAAIGVPVFLYVLRRSATGSVGV